MRRLAGYLAALGAILCALAIGVALQFPGLLGGSASRPAPIENAAPDASSPRPDDALAGREDGTAEDIEAKLRQRLPRAPDDAEVPAEPAIDQETALRQLRNVTPEGVLPGPPVTGRLTRLPDQPPPDLVALPPRPTRLFLVVVEQAGVVRSKDQRVNLAGVEPTPLDATCRKNDGSEVPCGRLAATALSRFIRTRAIDCQYPDGEDDDNRDEIVDASCTLGRQDIAEWLVGGGWARASADAPAALKEAESAARKDGRGIWQFENGFSG